MLRRPTFRFLLLLLLAVGAWGVSHWPHPAALPLAAALLGAILALLVVWSSGPPPCRSQDLLERCGRHQPLLEMDLDSGRVLCASPAAAALFERSPAELRGLRLGELRPAWSEDHLPSQLASLQAGEETFTAPGVPWLRLGEVLWWADVVAVRCTGDRAGRALLLLTNVTYRRHLEQELSRETERRLEAEQQLRHDRQQAEQDVQEYRALVDQAWEGVLQIEPEGLTLVAANPRAAELLGGSVPELIGRPWTELAASAERPGSRLLTGAGWRSATGPETLRLRRADGSRVEVEVTIVPRREGGWWVLLREESTRLREQLVRTAAQLEQQAEELEATHRRLEHAHRAKSHFLATVSHEIRTPLNAIVGFSELLEGAGEQLPARLRGFVADIRRASEHLLQLISDVLDLAQVEAGQMAIQSEPLALEPLLRGVRSVAEGLAQGKHLTLCLEVGASTLGAWGDERRVKQVLYNLLSNAVRYSPPESTVTVRAAREESRVRIEVRDQGPGIAAEHHDLIFEEFRRLPQPGSGASAKGSGLGLALSRHMVEAMGGILTVDSEPGRGSVFSFTLPAYDPPAVELPSEPDPVPGRN